MANCKFPFLIISIIIFFFLSVHAQNLNISLCPLTHADITKSMVCVSKADGTSLFEYVLTEDDIENGSEYHIEVPDPEHYCFSIINEYLDDTNNTGNPYYWGKTYYDMTGDLNILKFDHPPKRQEGFTKDHMSSVKINNAPVIEHWDHESEAAISTFKQTGSSIYAQADFKHDEDVFIVLKGQNDKWHKYIYIENDQEPITGSKIPIKQFQSDYKSLPDDLSYYAIPLPFDTPYRGYIKAFNSNTGKYCVFFSGANAIGGIIKSGMNEKYGTSAPKLKAVPGTLDLFLPPVALDHYEVSLTWGNWHESIAYNYRIHHGAILKFPFFQESNFVPEDIQYDKLGFKSRMNGYPDYFRIYFTQNKIDIIDSLPNGTITYKPTSDSPSYWIVIGKNSRDIQFNIPILSETNKALFPGSGKWRYEHFENVEFLEKDQNIDWINFFHDYNVLLVSYHDPFK